MTKYQRPRTSPKVCSERMPGCDSCATMRASRRKRSRPPWSAATSGRRHLDRDESLERAIAREVHRAHAAVAERPQDLVLLIERALERGVHLRLERARVAVHAERRGGGVGDRDARVARDCRRRRRRAARSESTSARSSASLPHARSTYVARSAPATPSRRPRPFSRRFHCSGVTRRPARV